MKKPELVSLLTATTVFVALVGAVFFFRTSFRPKILKDSDQSASSGSYSEEPFVDGRLNINGAGADELMLLPGVGKTLAERIVAYREEYGPFTNILELLLIDGFGQTTFDSVRDYISIGG